MIEELEKAITAAASKAEDAKDSGDAMRFSQAACNLASALAVVRHLPKT